MSCNDIDSMFDNDPNDLHDALLTDKLLWNNDNLSIHSADHTWDSFYDDMPGNLYDSLIDKNKDKPLDFDYSLTEFNELFETTTKPTIKAEPTHTNSVSSPYLTDECSPTSSSDNSPVGRKLKKRDFQAIDSSSEKSFALYDEIMEHPIKSAKIDMIKKENFQPRTIYKFSRDNKFEPREPIIINNGGPSQQKIIKIRQASYIKSVNISKFPQEKLFDGNSLKTSTFHSSSQNSYSPTAPEQDCDLLTGEFYDHEIDLYSDYKPRVGSYSNQNMFHSSNNQHNMNSSNLFQTPIPQSGPLYLTDEEKRTLLQENYPIPTRVPLTKQEERNLKKVRRKIKNKLSAQESRRKKKEYVDALEKKVEAYEQERMESKRRIETLENQQRTLQNQVRHYQHQLMNKITGTGNTTSTGLMLFMICFALILVGGSVPSSYRKMNLPQSSLISSSSLYYMGYGPSRNVFNDSHEISMGQNHVRNQPARLIDRTLDIDIIPRQSILLGEDSDDRNFEEFVMSYTKSNRKICDSNYKTDVIRNSVDMSRNSSVQSTNRREDIVIARLTNIDFVKLGR